jgi:hypothetical protein
LLKQLLYRRNYSIQLTWQRFGEVIGTRHHGIHARCGLTKSGRMLNSREPGIKIIITAAGIPVIKGGPLIGVQCIAKQHNHAVWRTPSQIRATGVCAITTAEIQNVIANLVGIAKGAETMTERRG